MRDWKICTETMTEGELVDYFVEGDEVLISSTLSEHTIYLNEKQVMDMICGLSYQLNLLREAKKK